jgi:rhodanese-related sulfurtransferase
MNPIHPIPSKSGKEVPFITAETLEEILTTNANGVRYLVIDCRFEYEYEGGHIQTAVNLKNMEEMENFFIRGDKPVFPDGATTVLIFHCEFSSERGPKL